MEDTKRKGYNDNRNCREDEQEVHIYIHYVVDLIEDFLASYDEDNGERSNLLFLFAAIEHQNEI